ncbi:cadherin-like protein 26 [Odontesthes bonariensis]|uniref:cadherin-like protein 26 n=1 Tax=Odontesthes bonariensis TaxID=219752 RepID=UPI003F589BD2
MTRSISLLLLVTVAALGECCDGRHNSRYKRDLLVRSKRRWVLSTIDLEEELKVDYPHQISQMFNDKTPGKIYAFSISGEGVDDGLFSIDANTGKVYAHKPIDREKKSSYHIKFDVWDKLTNTKMDRELAFDVDIADINDNAPEFVEPPETASVTENTTEGYLPVSVEVTDKDKERTNNSAITVTVISQDPKEPKIEAHQFDNRMTRLKFNGCFDYDKVKQYKVTIEAKDHGTPALSSTTVVTLNILDTNSHQPMFKERQYEAEALEMATHENLLRVAVEDKDTKSDDGNWRAQYFFIGGNKEGLFKIVTDPKTNEGVLSVVKEENYEKTTLVQLQIGVKNTGQLSVCKNGKILTDESALPPPDSVNITIKMIDTNDPPVFKKNIVDVHVREETEPGHILFTPDVHDVDSENIRFELVEDLADWVSVDEKTGQITTTKKMDRESPFVDANGVYQVVIAAIDDGEPPATSTCIINIHVQDINDHTPKLVNNSIIMCGNRVNKVTVSVEDLDADPYSGPFTFSLEDDETLKQLWKLDPAYGEQVSLVSLRSLLYGNYSVPLVMQDKQNALGRETLEVVVCDCGEKDECRDKLPLSSEIGTAGIGLIIAGLLSFLILLLVFAIKCGEKPFEYMEKDEGHQTLIKYNQEGGGASCKAGPSVFTPTSDITVTDGLKQGYFTQTYEHAPVTTYNVIQNTGHNEINYNTLPLSLHGQREFRMNYEGHSAGTQHSTWATNKRQTYHGHSSFNKGSAWSDQRAANQWKMIHTMTERNIADGPVYQPCVYANEEISSRCLSLDKLSVSNLGDDLEFLNDLGPKFKTLAGVCNQTIRAKNMPF